MSFVPGIIIEWTGTNASIPSGWTRETNLDDKYPKGQGSEAPATTGGSSSHTHSSPAHSHTLNSHTHSYTTGPRTGGALNGGNPAGPGVIIAAHTHTGTTGVSSGGTTSADAVTYGSASNHPPYLTVIFIRCTTNTPFVPQNASILIDSSTVPTGFGYHNGIAASPDYRGHYLKGGLTGADAWFTGGSYTNVHDITHTHTPSTHTHADANTNTSTDTTLNEAGGGLMTRDTHVHNAVASTGTQAINAFTSSLTTVETVEPLYRKLNMIKNISGGNALAQVGMIALWRGAVNDIPQGWSLYSQQNDYFLKMTNSLGEAGMTGGSNTHTHGSQSHTHTSNGSHTHSMTYGTSNLNNNGVQPGGTDGTRDGHEHTGTTSDGTQADYASSTTTANSSSNQPPYSTVCYIKLDYLSGGAILTLF